MPVTTLTTPIYLHGGYPDLEAIPELYDELDHQRAVQIYIWATPLVGMQVLSEGLDRDLGLSANIGGIFENFLDAKTIVATGNGQSIYAFGPIDLSETGPVVLEVPPGVLGFLMGAWQQPLADLGPLGPDKGKGGKYLLVPPGQDAPASGDYFAVPSDSFLINWTLRGFVKDGKTEPAVQAIRQMRVYRLLDKDNPPAMKFLNVSGKKATLIPLGDTLGGLLFFEKLATAIQREPAREQDKQFLGMLASLGIEKGKPFAPDARMKKILTSAAETGRAVAAMLAYESRYPRKLRWPGTSRWEELFLSERADFVNPNFIDLDARAALYYQAAGASKHALDDVVGAGSKYAGAFKDGEGRWLMGENSYKLRVPPNPPVKDFWSVPVYDAQTRSMIDTGQRCSGRDSYHALKTNADGSIDLYFGPKQPEGNETNWVQTKPGIGFFLYFRWYGPLRPYFDKSWRLPDVERV
jgi:hypothetical protein